MKDRIITHKMEVDYCTTMYGLIIKMMENKHNAIIKYLDNGDYDCINMEGMNNFLFMADYHGEKVRDFIIIAEAKTYYDYNKNTPDNYCNISTRNILSDINYKGLIDEDEWESDKDRDYGYKRMAISDVFYGFTNRK